MAITLAELCARKGIVLPSRTNPTIKIEEPISQKEKTFSLDIELDIDQSQAVELALAGKSFCLIGKAGTGKTTTEREIVKAILKNNGKASHIFRIQGTGERVEGPAAAVVSYTRVATGNSKKAICKDKELEDRFFHNITTIHNLLEFAPVYYWDDEKQKETMRFIPARDSGNPLTTKVIAFEEASMIDLTLWEKVYDAMMHETQCIFIGDINQLPPVFGPSILNYALVQLPIVELRTVYRQKFNSTVLKNAHNILEGKPLEIAPDFKIIEGGEKQHGQNITSLLLINSLQKWFKEGTYNPAEDIVLSPFNVGALGTDNLNNHIAGFVNPGEVFEIIAGVHKFYLAVGDKIMYAKQVGTVTRIHRNGLYSGRATKPASFNMDRFGKLKGVDELEDEEDDDSVTVEYNLESLTAEQLKELTHQASHVVEIELETGETLALSKAGDLGMSNFTLGYALTVHKSQGSEWKHVIIVLHKDHSIMAFNELLYTAVTRAAEKVTIVAKKFMLEKAIATRRLKGDTIREKVEFFNSNKMIEGIFCRKG
jgi:ATP-dependent exoDNAse (exonuclease V) alpha subunit